MGVMVMRKSIQRHINPKVVNRLKEIAQRQHVLAPMFTVTDHALFSAEGHRFQTAFRKTLVGEPKVQCWPARERYHLHDIVVVEGAVRFELLGGAFRSSDGGRIKEYISVPNTDEAFRMFEGFREFLEGLFDELDGLVVPEEDEPGFTTDSVWGSW